MDVYLFIQTEPGMATSVMNALVQAKAVTRAAAITGKHDVFARIDNVEFNELGTRLVDQVQRTPGVLRTTTSAGLPVSAAFTRPTGISIPTMPLRTAATSQPQALVFARVQPGMGEAALKTLSQAKSVLSLALLTGEYDAVMQVSGPTVEAIARKVMREIQTVPGIVSTTTSIVAAITPFVAPGAARARGRGRGKARKRPAKAKKRAPAKAKARKRTTRRGRR